ncbi:transglycosylase domain-containing protein [Robertmurraya korlensis]|uniref:transglycosylase domain-containing protein n=1 Tax=Robertmurraya korlensis TaxID=519977 RepID=UPI0008265E56|nr:transglycosylase domain-containing protein [Robertmurraya korlensis]
MEVITDQRFKRTMKYIRAFLILGSIGLGLLVLVVTGVLIYAKVQGPPPLAVPQSSLYYSDDGKVIGESNNGEKRYWVGINEISPHLIEATVAIEDRSFYEHNGFDFKRIAGAALADIKAMAKVQGASTISQQYARNLFLEHEKTWKRKLLEALYTIRIEMNYTKNEILEGYLNTIYYGKGAYGIQAASQYYLGKDAADLTLGEASMLAGIPKGPSYYSPLISEENAKERQKIILDSMVKNKYITAADANTAINEKLAFIGEHSHAVIEIAPYFQDAVKQSLKNDLGLDDRTIELGGLRVYTTLDTEQQELAEKNVSTHMAKESELQVALVSMNPKNGYVKAMVGGRDYVESPFNRAVQAVRQPGSTVKPFLYYAAITQGFTPASLVRSEMTTFRFDDGRAEYTPHNFNNRYAGKEITMAQALALSDNVYAVKTHLFLGEETLVKTAKQFGITTPMESVPSLALGTSGVKVIDMANAYSLFANGGKKVKPVLIKRVENHRGEVIYEFEKENERVLKADAAFVMTHMMTGMFDKKLDGYSNVTGSSMVNDMTRIYAGKSGSTDSDSWMVGFSPQLVTAVWTGYDQGNPIEIVAEKSYAKNIWVNYMEDALANEPIKNFKAPKGTVGVYIDPESGLLATDDCPVKRLTYFIAGTEPTKHCINHLEHDAKKPTEKKKEEKKEKKTWYKKIFDWS